MRLRDRSIIRSIKSKFKSNRKSIFEFLVFSALVITVGYLFFSSLFIICDYHDPLGINPPEQIHLKKISLDFPSLNPMTMPIEINGNLVNAPLAHVDVLLQYRGVLGEGAPVDVGAVGNIFPYGKNIIQKGLSSTNPLYNLSLSNLPRHEPPPPINGYIVFLTFVGASEYNKTNPNCASPGLTIPITLEESPDPMIARCYNQLILNPVDIKKTR